MNNDLWLIYECQRGNPDAYAKLYDKYHLKVFRTALHLVREKALAEDITQEVFISVFQKVKDLKNPSAFKTWLYRIAVSKVSHLIRDNGGIERNLPLEYIEEDKHASSDCLLEVVDRTEADALRTAIHCLPDELRLPVLLHYFSDLSIKEVARVLEIPPGTVKSRLFTARARLASALESTTADFTGIIKEAKV